jgi:hypothetical protein
MGWNTGRFYPAQLVRKECAKQGSFETCLGVAEWGARAGLVLQHGALRTSVDQFQSLVAQGW